MLRHLIAHRLMSHRLTMLAGLAAFIGLGCAIAFLPVAGLFPSATPLSVIGDANAQEVPTGKFQRLATAPDIGGVIISDPNGDVDLGRYKGKALLVNIWATWCPPCVAEMPSLDRLQAKLGSDRFSVVTVAVDEPNMSAVEDFLAKHELKNLPVLLDLNHAIDQKIRLRSLPTSLLVSPDGIILARFAGDNKWDCGKPLAAIEGFIKTGDIPTDRLDPCEN